jgi:peptidoglycan/xylan/chitin deacetylase (PgdA/CDA1 family)
MTWPRGARCAVAFTFTFDFDAESVWAAIDPENADRPGVLSQGTYGAKVAVPLILDLLARHDVRATFFVVGQVAERYPERVGAIAAAGHELAVHGYTHTGPAQLSAEEEEGELVQARAVLDRFGAPVTGYRSPSWDLSTRTLDLLERHGFLYSSNLMDDIRPYRHEGRSLVELPVQWMLDDAAHWWFSLQDWSRKIATTAEVQAIWEEEVLGIRELAGACILTMHPEIVGRPSRLAFLDRFLSFVRELDGAWIATCHEIARHVG